MYWVNTSIESPAATITSTSSSSAASLPERPAKAARLVQVLRWVVADLLQCGEQLENEAPPLDALLRAIAAIVSRTTASYSVDLLGR